MSEKKKGRILWLWVTLAFVGLIAAWTVLIVISVKNRPEAVPLETVPLETVPLETVERGSDG